MQNRPFENAEEMNEALIENYNSVVHKEDTVYILGDIAYRIGVTYANEMISRLNGKKYLIKGNHDKNFDESLFEEIRDFMTVTINGHFIALMHYPMMSWPRSHYGSIMLHGHIHSDGKYNIENRENGILRYDVGVDANNYAPVSMKEIENFMGLQSVE
jgi:calcineurin-like phosphoesterase family protein